MRHIFALTITLLTITLSAQAAQINVTFINPGFEQRNPTGPFWHEVAQIMQASADSFDINLRIEYANRNHIIMKSLIAEALKKSQDFLILVDEKGITTEHLLTIKNRSTSIYYLLNKPNEDALTRLNMHGYKIAGSVIPDNFQAGKQLINSLASLNNSTLPLNILALEGDYSTNASLERSAGLHSEIKKHKTMTLVDSVIVNWSEEQSYLKSVGLLKRNPHINTIWCANDAIAKGAIQALVDLKKRSSVNVGAINWSQPTLNNGIEIEIGGHVTLGGLAIVKLYDIYNNAGPVKPEHLELAVFSNKNQHAVQLLSKLKNKTLNELNFMKFSETTDQPVNFSIVNLID